MALNLIGTPTPWPRRVPAPSSILHHSHAHRGDPEALTLGTVVQQKTIIGATFFTFQKLEPCVSLAHSNYTLPIVNCQPSHLLNTQLKWQRNSSDAWNISRTQLKNGSLPQQLQTSDNSQENHRQKRPAMTLQPYHGSPQRVQPYLGSPLRVAPPS